MNLLLDTVSFLWLLTDSPSLSPKAREAFRDPANSAVLSAVSAWEIGVKHALGRLPLPEAPSRFVPAMREAHGIEPLPLDEPSTLYLEKLPSLHRDPFDRMLICQAICHGLTFLTPDEAIRNYPVATLW